MKKLVNFKALEYVRPEFEQINATVELLANEVKEAKTFYDVKAAIERLDELEAEITTNSYIAFIRGYLDSSDQYYQKEMQECMQKLATINLTDFNNAIINSPFVKEIDNEYGKQYLICLKNDLRIKSKGIELRGQEQGLIGEYQRLKATIKIDFKGESLSEGEMQKYLTSEDRNVRREASIAVHKGFISLKKEFNDILSQLIEVRNEIAKENGFLNYAEYMNVEKRRLDYGQKDLLDFCENVKDELLDFCSTISNEQANRLGLEKMSSYDTNINFLDGNAKPLGNGKDLREIAKKMYSNLGKDISEMYNAMVDGDYIDVSESPNKITGMGFCTDLPILKITYIFGNCNGSIHDVDVLTHEVGHAYQGYLSMKKHKLNLYANMPNDVAEIPSKAMEHFTQDYAELFFGDDANKFRLEFLKNSLEETLRFCSIHEFESWLYSNPQATEYERARVYFEGVKEMEGGVDYSEIEQYALEGSLLFRNMGVYMFPFYLISYAISSISAMEFAKRMSEDKEATWRDYTNLCEAGGSLPYYELLKVGNLHSPFEKETIKNSLGFVKEKLLKCLDM